MNRFLSIDCYKCVCAFLVVLIHSQYPYKDAVLPITTIAVPSFFCMSGFLSWNSLQKKERIYRIIKILLCSIGIFYCKTFLMSIISSRIFYFPSWQEIIDFFLFNDVSFANHLWYLSAYIYVLLMVCFLGKKCVYAISFIFLGALVHWIAITKGLPEHVYRNAILQGLPYFSLGAFIRCLYDKNIIFKCRSFIPFIIVVVLAIYFTPSNDTNSFIKIFYRDTFRFIIVIIGFIGVLSYTGMHENIMSRIGRNYSLYIYVFHPIPLIVLQQIIGKFSGVSFYLLSSLNPFIITIVCIIVTKYLKKYNLLPF